MNYFEIFPWHEHFETGIQEIDDQHKNIVDILNKIAFSAIEYKHYDLEKNFRDLLAYAEEHFNTEEQILKQYIDSCDKNIFEQYPNLEGNIKNHINGHGSFLPSILEIKNQNKSFELKANDLVIFLIKWLSNHIVAEDKKLFLIIDSLTNINEDHNSTYTKDDFLDSIELEYNNLSIKCIEFILERAKKMKVVKSLNKINIELKELI